MEKKIGDTPSATLITIVSGQDCAVVKIKKYILKNIIIEILK